MKRNYILLLTVILFSSCIGDFVNKSTQEKDVEYRVVKISDQYKMKIPTYMKSTKELNEDASLQYMNAFKETYIMVIDQRKSELRDYFYSPASGNNFNSLARKYRDLHMKMFEDDLENYQLVEEKESEINGMTSIVSKVEGKSEGTGVAYTFGFFDGEDHVYMVLCWTLLDRKQRYNPTFNTMLNSFFEVR